MEQVDGQADDRRFNGSSRKVRLHHRTSTSSLARSTIQENGIYDKQIDVFKAKVVKLFRFIDQWRSLIVHSAADKKFLKMMVASSAGSVSEQLQRHSRVITSPADQVPLARQVSLEDELQTRLDRMSNIAKTLRQLYNKERDVKLGMYSHARKCRDNCFDLVAEMLSHFDKQAGVLQVRIVELEAGDDKVEDEKLKAKQTYEEMVEQVSKQISSLEDDLQAAENTIVQFSSEKKELSTHNDILVNENEELKQRNSELSEDNEILKNDITKLNDEINSAKRNVLNLEAKANSLEMTRAHYETLLEIALSKLRMYEEGEVIRRRSRGTTSLSRLPGFVIKNNPGDLSEMSLKEVPQTIKKQVMLDNISITSFETATSEISLPSMSNTSYFESARQDLFDRLSIVSQTKQPTPSPNVAPRKRNRLKEAFTRQTLKKSVSIDSNIGRQSRTVSMERLPIRVESVERLALLPNLGTSTPRRQDSRTSQTNSEEIWTEDDQSFEDSYPSKKVAQRVEFFEKAGNGTIEHLENDHDYLNNHKKQESNRKRLDPKKVQRTSSFGALKSKIGLVALAKDIERRFKKRKRSKTTDFSGLFRNREDLPDSDML